MVIGLIKRFFAPEAPAAPVKPVANDPGKPELEEFVDYVVRALVDTPDEVRVTSEDKDEHTTITVACRKGDVGKIIGKSGKTIAAIRALTNGAAGRIGKRVNVEILD